MHIPDGLLPGVVTLAGYGAAGIMSLLVTLKKRILPEIIPRASVVTAALFVASLIHIPVGVTTVHFSFVGLAGILLGPAAFLSVAVALTLQVLLFHHGGYSTLGVNIFNFGCASLAGYCIFSLRRFFTPRPAGLTTLAFLAGSLSTVIKVTLGSLSLLSGGFALSVAVSIMVYHIPIILGEGLLTAALVTSLYKKQRSFIYGEGSSLSWPES